MLTTSREPLGVPGETVWRVPSLVEDEAVRLFADRAVLVRSGFDPDAHRDAVRAICRRLDGIPLAIALAAARARGRVGGRPTVVTPEIIRAARDMLPNPDTQHHRHRPAARHQPRHPLQPHPRPARTTRRRTSPSPTPHQHRQLRSRARRAGNLSA